MTSFFFDVTRTSGFTTVTQLQEFSSGASSMFIAAHVKDTAGTGDGITGYSGASSVHSPEPTSMLLFGTTLAGLAAARQYLKRKTA